jgi:hypothetical protein
MRPCTVCQKPDRASIDLKLLRGQTASSIAKEHDLKIDALLRHKANHLAKSTEGSTTISMLKQVIAELDQVALTAMAAGDHRAVIDSRKRKTDAIESLIQIELSKANNPEQTQQTITNRISLKSLDQIVAKVESALTFAKQYGGCCPLCRRPFIPELPPKPQPEILPDNHLN